MRILFTGFLEFSKNVSLKMDFCEEHFLFLHRQVNVGCGIAVTAARFRCRFKKKKKGQGVKDQVLWLENQRHLLVFFLEPQKTLDTLSMTAI